jgi:hypothetical protein
MQTIRIMRSYVQYEQRLKKKDGESSTGHQYLRQAQVLREFKLKGGNEETRSTGTKIKVFCGQDAQGNMEL